jgi:hypothetical protein
MPVGAMRVGPAAVARAAAIARFGIVMACTLIGFWRSLIG